MSGGSNPVVARELQQSFEAATDAARQMEDEFVSTEHLLLALVRVKSPASRILEMNAVDEKSITVGVPDVLGSNATFRPEAETLSSVTEISSSSSILSSAVVAIVIVPVVLPAAIVMVCEVWAV